MTDDKDVCKNRHGGNAESVAANKKAPKKSRDNSRDRIFEHAAGKGFHGVTANELYFDIGGGCETSGSKMSISGAGARLSEMSFGDYGEHLRMFPIGEKRFTRTHDGKTYSGRVHVTPLYHHLMLIAGDKRALFVKPPRKSKK